MENAKKINHCDAEMEKFLEGSWTPEVSQAPGRYAHISSITGQQWFWSEPIPETYELNAKATIEPYLVK